MIQPNFIAAYIVDPNAFNEPLYLLLQRSKESYLPGIWQMVTGKLDSNESASDAVQREIHEETGLICRTIYNVDVTMFYDQLKNRISFSANFCAFTDHTNPILLSKNEHEAYKWCTFSEALDFLAFPAQKETLSFIHHRYILQKPHEVNILKTSNFKS
jgi:dATP pyrophosphohydrolase